jgi:hypothetical protein
MCGKMAVISGEHDSNQNRVLVEQIDEISYTFDTAGLRNDVQKV